MTWRLLAAGIGLAVGLIAADPPRPGVPLIAPREPDLTGLHNVQRWTPRVLSGSSPEGADGFATLRRLGVRTVLSVDGAPPEVELAARHGLRSVHLPVGYDGIAPAQLLRITKAVRDLPSPVYVHCHHGKHRGPAAVAAALVGLGEMTPAAAVEGLKRAGTDPRYRGLIDLPFTLHRPSHADLDNAPADFPARTEPADLTQVMVRIDDTWDRLKSGRDPGHEAVLLQEHYREAARLDGVKRRGEAFVTLFAEAEAAAKQLQASPQQAATLAAAQTLCTQCHAKFRD